jgi:homopolymeric O-antigen transport system permease protein
MSGMINGFRHAMLGGPIDGTLIALSSVVSISLFVLGLFIFRRTERRFADII